MAQPSGHDTRYRDILSQAILERQHSLTDAESLNELIEHLGNKRVVMLGEATHGTSEFYLWRSIISQRLIAEKNFTFIAVEGDWPDCYAINRYIKGYKEAGASAYDVLKTFRRWPTWMWANREAERLAEWLRGYNDRMPHSRHIGFFGLDVYSLWDSLEAVVAYLETTNPMAARQARELYKCFEPYSYNEDIYAYEASPLRNCEQAAVNMLEEMVRKRSVFAGDFEAAFNAEQNAFVVKNAEHYYRTMFQGSVASWNLRDRHMMDTLLRLLEFHGDASKAIVWAHNTHVGDAYYTDMRNCGEFNIGQLARRIIGKDDVALVGFGTYRGSAIAAPAWEARMKVMHIPGSREGSWERLLHDIKVGNMYLNCAEFTVSSVYDQLLKQRAVGVVYHPQSEYGNYVPTKLFKRYDHYMYLDHTTAVHPIHTADIDLSLLPETYPVSV